MYNLYYRGPMLLLFLCSPCRRNVHRRTYTSKCTSNIHQSGVHNGTITISSGNGMQILNNITHRFILLLVLPIHSNNRYRFNILYNYSTQSKETASQGVNAASKRSFKIQLEVIISAPIKFSWIQSDSSDKEVKLGNDEVQMMKFK